MKHRNHTPEQIVRKLREADRMLGEGAQSPGGALAIEVGPSITGDQMLAVLARLTAIHGESLRVDGQRHRNDLQRHRRLVPVRSFRHRVHRSKVTLAEPLCGIVQWQTPRLVAGC